MKATTCLFSTMSRMSETLLAGSAPSSAVYTWTGWPAMPPWAFTQAAHTWVSGPAPASDDPAAPL